MQPHNILIDTDIGDDVDDILALAFALLRPELRVRAVTTVSYDTNRRCHLVARLLSCLGLSDIPYAPGLQLPLRPATPDEVHRALQPGGYILNHYPLAGEAERAASPPAPDAVELIARTVKQNLGNITLVAIGPLSNFAAALCRYPEIIPQIRNIAIMGGEMSLNRSEHNIAWDAAAAEIVFGAGVPLFMGTWNVTRDFVLSPEDCQSIGQHNSPLCQLLHQAIELWWPHKGGKTGPVMYDIAPILWAYAPHYFTTETMNVQIETRGQHTRGFTVRGSGLPNATVSQTMQARRVRELYLETIQEWTPNTGAESLTAFPLSTSFPMQK